MGAYNKAIQNHGRSVVAVFAEKGVGMASTVVSSALMKKVVSGGTGVVTQAAGGVVGTTLAALPLVNAGLGVGNLAVGVHNGYLISHP